MRDILIACAGVLALVGAVQPAQAEETVVRTETRPDVTVEHREGVVERRETTTSEGCGSKTVHKEDGAGNSTTVHKEGC